MDEEGEGGVLEWLGEEDTGPGGGPWWPTPSLRLANCEVQEDLESMPRKSNSVLWVSHSPLGQSLRVGTVFFPGPVLPGGPREEHMPGGWAGEGVGD